LTSRSGNETQFASMVRRCKAAGVGVYADAVFNHMAGPWGGVGIAGSEYGNRSYPIYSPWDFHHVKGTDAYNCGVVNYDDKYNVQFCDLAGMPDLCTGCPYVQKTVAAYINRMAEIGIAGIRVDAAKHQDPKELGRLLAMVDKNLFRFQEVLYGGTVNSSSYVANGRVCEFRYAESLAPKFAAPGQFAKDLAMIGTKWGFHQGRDSVVFVDNHDTQRDGSARLTYKSGRAYVLANVFMLAHPYGYPKVMSSYAFSNVTSGPPAEPVHGPGGLVRCGPGQPWICEHRHPGLAAMIAWRRVAGVAPISLFHTSERGNILALCRGRSACVAINRSGRAFELHVETSLPSGWYCDVFNSGDGACNVIPVTAGRKVVLTVPAMGAVAMHIGATAKAAPALRGGD